MDRQLRHQGQGLQQVVQELREAQEQVLEQAQEVVRALGLAAAHLESLALAQQKALEWDLQARAPQQEALSAEVQGWVQLELDLELE